MFFKSFSYRRYLKTSHTIISPIRDVISLIVYKCYSYLCLLKATFPRIFLVQLIYTSDVIFQATEDFNFPLFTFSTFKQLKFHITAMLRSASERSLLKSNNNYRKYKYMFFMQIINTFCIAFGHLDWNRNSFGFCTRINRIH